MPCTGECLPPPVLGRAGGSTAPSSAPPSAVGSPPLTPRLTPPLPRLEAAHQHLLVLWHQLHLDMRSLLSWQYLIRDIQQIQSWSHLTVSRPPVPAQGSALLGGVPGGVPLRRRGLTAPFAPPRPVPHDAGGGVPAGPAQPGDPLPGVPAGQPGLAELPARRPAACGARVQRLHPEVRAAAAQPGER